MQILQAEAYRGPPTRQTNLNLLRNVQKNPDSRSLSSRQFTILGLIGIILGLADGLAKVLALNLLPEEQATDLLPVFSLAVHKNPGILFDIPLPLSVIAILTVLALILLARLILQYKNIHPAASLGALFAFIGALNNLFDRLINNFTTDYIIILRTSAINISDVLIFVGVILILWYSRSNSPKALSKVEGHAQQN